MESLVWRSIKRFRELDDATALAVWNSLSEQDRELVEHLRDWDETAPDASLKQVNDRLTERCQWLNERLEQQEEELERCRKQQQVEELRQLEAMHDAEKDRLRKESEEKVAELREELQAFEELRQNQKETHAKNLSLTQVNIRLTEQCQQLNERLAQQQEELEQHRKKLQGQKVELERQLASLQIQNDAEKEALQKEAEEERTEHQAELQELEKLHHGQMNMLQKNMTEQSKQEYKLHLQMNARLVQKNKELERRHKMGQGHEEEKEQLSRQLESLQAQLEAEHAAEKEVLQREATKERAEHKAELQELQELHRNEISTLQKNMRMQCQEINAQKEVLQREAAEERAKHQAELQELQELHRNQINALQKNMGVQCQKISTRLEQKNKELERYRELGERQKQELSQKLASLQTKPEPEFEAKEGGSHQEELQADMMEQRQQANTQLGRQHEKVQRCSEQQRLESRKKNYPKGKCRKKIRKSDKSTNTFGGGKPSITSFGKPKDATAVVRKSLMDTDKDMIDSFKHLDQAMNQVVSSEDKGICDTLVKEAECNEEMIARSSRDKASRKNPNLVMSFSDLDDAVALAVRNSLITEDKGIFESFRNLAVAMDKESQNSTDSAPRVSCTSSQRDGEAKPNDSAKSRVEHAAEPAPLRSMRHQYDTDKKFVKRRPATLPEGNSNHLSRLIRRRAEKYTESVPEKGEDGLSCGCNVEFSSKLTD